jgi:hypothetical protein
MSLLKKFFNKAGRKVVRKVVDHIFDPNHSDSDRKEGRIIPSTHDGSPLRHPDAFKQFDKKK